MSGVEWVPLAGTAMSVGDLVSAEAGGMPIYRVVAVDADQAWVREEQQPSVQVKPACAFHWKAREQR